MKRLVEWLIAVLELLEAEGRQGARAVRGLVTAVVIAGVCGVVMVMGVAALLGALYLGLVQAVPAAWSAFLTGIAAVLAGGVGLWLTRGMHR